MNTALKSRKWLRFPDFTHLEKWNFVPLRELATRITHRNSDGKYNRVLTNSAEFGIVDQKDYFDRDIVTQGNLDTYYIVEDGDYVYNPRVSSIAAVGPISKNRIGTGVMSPLYTIFRFHNDENDFYAYYFKSNHWHEYLRRVSNSGARFDRMSISNDAFMDMPIPMPDADEQQEIVICLTSLDELIAAESGKLNALKTHKKGLMQQLFQSPERD